MVNKAKLAFAVILIGLSLAGSSLAEEALNQWGYFKNIHPAANSKYISFFTDPEIYQHSLRHLQDLRIVDREGKFVPYYIESGYTTQQQQELSYTTQLIDSYKKDNDTYLDYKVLNTTETTDITANQLVFALPNKSLLRQVNIRGSYDGNNWEDITQDTIYSVDGLIKNTIYLKGVKKYTHYRVKIIDNVDNTVFSGLQVVNTWRSKQWNEYIHDTRLQYDVSTADKLTRITLQNPSHLNIQSITLDVEGNFQRSYDLLADNIPIRGLHSGKIYNLRFQDLNITNTRIELDKQPISAQEITVIIHNQDNRPLVIKDIHTQYSLDKIVFEDVGASPYRLYLGNKEATKPSYEIEGYKNHVEKETQTQVTLGRLQVTKSPELPPVGEQLQLGWLFNIIIGLVSLSLVVFLILKLR